LRAGILALLGVVVAGRDSKSLHLSLNEMVRNIRAKDTTVTIVKALQWLKKKKKKKRIPWFPLSPARLNYLSKNKGGGEFPRVERSSLYSVPYYFLNLGQ